MLPAPEIDLAEKCIAVVALFTRDNECLYCFRKMANRRLSLTLGDLDRTRDHYVPASRGGRKTVRCCNQCNRLKKDRTPAEWHKFMVRNRGYFGPKPPPKPPVNRIPKPVLTYDETRAFLQLSALRASPSYLPVQKEYDDPIAQLAFELAMQNPRNRRVLDREAARHAKIINAEPRLQDVMQMWPGAEMVEVRRRTTNSETFGQPDASQ